MSNLNLPTLTRDNLSRLMGAQTSLKLAYATEAVRLSDDFEGPIAILHHNSIIAKVGQNGYVWVNTCGYDSRTTINRINMVLRDNDVPYVAAIRQREGKLLTRQGLAPVMPLTKHTFVGGVLM